MMLRKSIGLLTLSGCVTAVGCGVSASATGLTPAFAELARAAHGYMKSDLIPSIGTARFPTTMTASRARVKSIQTKAASDADKGLWLVLMMVNVKSSESNSMGEELAIRPSRAAQSAAADLTAERDMCVWEAEEWLSGPASRVSKMKTGACLQQALQAAAVLGKK